MTPYSSTIPYRLSEKIVQAFVNTIMVKPNQFNAIVYKHKIEIIVYFLEGIFKLSNIAKVVCMKNLKIPSLA